MFKEGGKDTPTLPFSYPAYHWSLALSFFLRIIFDAFIFLLFSAAKFVLLGLRQCLSWWFQSASLTTLTLSSLGFSAKYQEKKVNNRMDESHQMCTMI